MVHGSPRHEISSTINVPTAIKTPPANTTRPSSRTRAQRLQQQRASSQSPRRGTVGSSAPFNSPRGYSSSNNHRRPSPLARRASPARSRSNSQDRGKTTPSPPDPAATRLDGAKAAVAGSNESICDYDTSATQLYELLESSCWEQARARCRSHADEVRTWIVRKDSSLKVRWKLLPLHAAIIFQAPNFVIATLLEKYPGAASRKDDQGMLPLHLAFRHKQEDEDLLELLLIQYPKAVLIRDRRERVPLEHGRDCKFTAKLMRLFADATVAASRATAVVPPASPSTAGGTLPTASLTASNFSGSHHQHVSPRMEAEHQSRIARLRSEYEAKIRSIKADHEERLDQLRAHSDRNLEQLQLHVEKEQQALQERHVDEMNELRELLSTQVGKERQNMGHWEQEAVQLREAFAVEKTRQEKISAQYGRLHAYNDELRELLQEINSEQERVKELVERQQEELVASRTMRKEMIQSMLHREDDSVEKDRLRASSVKELAGSIQSRIQEVLQGTLGKAPIRERSRIDAERDQESEDVLKQTRKEFYRHEHSQDYYNESGKTSLVAVNDFYHGGGMRQSDRMIQTDEISAITEMSH